MEPKTQAVKPSIPEQNLVNTDDNEVGIKRLFSKAKAKLKLKLKLESESESECESEEGISRKTKIIVLTECPTTTEPCAIYYTDTLSQSLLIVCKNAKHTTNSDIEKKVEGMDKLGRQPAEAPTNNRLRMETTASNSSNCHG